MTARRHRSPLAALVLAVVVLLAACAADSAPAPDAAPGSSVLDAAPVDFSTRGPYPVGTMSLDAGTTKAVLYYPADPAATGSARHVTSYNPADGLDPAVRGYLAPLVPELVQDVGLDLYQDVAINDEGPFPVVLHSHGVGGSPLVESAHLAHLASWGFVVAAPEHRTRTLAALAAGAVTEDESDVADLRATLAALGREDTRPGSPLLTGVDTTAIGVEGLDAGAGATYRFAVSEPRVKAWIGQAPTSITTADRPAAAPLRRPALIITGEQDTLVPLADVEAELAALGAPKHLAVVRGAGHASFLDACARLRRSGGLGAYAASLPALVPILERNDDGCAPANIDPARASDYLNHLSVATYRHALGLDSQDMSLRDDFLRRRFPEAAVLPGQGEAAP